MYILINGEKHFLDGSKVAEGVAIIPDTSHPLCMGLTLGFVNVPPHNLLDKNEHPLYEISGDFTDNEIKDILRDPWQIFRPLSSHYDRGVLPTDKSKKYHSEHPKG